MERNRVPLAVEDYLNWLKARGLKEATVRNQRTSLQFLIDACGDIRVSSITAAHLDRMLAAGSARGWGARTKNIRMEHVGSFVEWAKQRKLLPATAEPMLGWRPLRVPQRRWLRVPATEWEGLLAAAGWPVDRAMIAVALHLCLRIGEITSLNVGDLHLEDYSIDITRHKTGAVDTMPISLELESELRTYLAWYTARLAGQGLPLRSSHTRPGSEAVSCCGVPSGMKRLVKTWRKAGLSRPQPTRTRLISVIDSRRCASVVARRSAPRAYAPTSTSCDTRSGCRTA